MLGEIRHGGSDATKALVIRLVCWFVDWAPGRPLEIQLCNLLKNQDRRTIGSKNFFGQLEQTACLPPPAEWYPSRPLGTNGEEPFPEGELLAALVHSR